MMQITEKTENEKESALSHHEINLLRPKLGAMYGGTIINGTVIHDPPQIESLVTSSMDLGESSKDVIIP
jgi:hypothetical protein